MMNVVTTPYVPEPPVPDSQWKPVSEIFDGSLYSAFSLVRVEGWCRVGYARYNHLTHTWGIEEPWLNDVLRKSGEARITHWLAIPLSIIH